MYQGKYQNQDTAAPVRRRRPPQKKPTGLTGTIVFYAALLLVVIAFLIGMWFVIGALNDWLVRFEASQPHTKCEEVFSELFGQPDWAEIYRLSGTEDHDDVTPDRYATYMENLVGEEDLNYIQTSAGLSGDRKYIVRAGTKKLATFTLTQVDPKADIPDWKLGTVEIFYALEEGCRIVTTPDCTVLVNGEAPDESKVLKTVTTKAESYLPEGVHGYRSVEMAVEGYLLPPTVEILDAEGNVLPVSLDEETQTYSYLPTSGVLGEEEQTTLVNAAKVYCKYMIGAVGKSELRSCFDSSTRIYSTITSNTTWMQSYAGYEFSEATVTDYYRYSDKLYSAKVSLRLNVSRKDGTVKEYDLSSTFFLKNSGSWKVTEMTNANPQEQVVQVRLTYKDGDKLLHTEMVNADTNTVTPPEVAVPAGKVFSGWFTETADEKGNKTMTLAFPPSENSTVTLPSDNVLKPMVLYALFENQEG